MSHGLEAVKLMKVMATDLSWKPADIRKQADLRSTVCMTYLNRLGYVDRFKNGKRMALYGPKLHADCVALSAKGMQIMKVTDWEKIIPQQIKQQESYHAKQRANYKAAQKLIKTPEYVEWQEAKVEGIKAATMSIAEVKPTEQKPLKFDLHDFEMFKLYYSLMNK